ncbi:hypothetical protein J6590_068606 [Homalodisca vitripennis]|nr:hypothetical protein J6590_068606 [Homalodisca vitripennis]
MPCTVYCVPCTVCRVPYLVTVITAMSLSVSQIAARVGRHRCPCRRLLFHARRQTAHYGRC